MVCVGRFAEALRNAGLAGVVGPAKEADDRIWEVVNGIPWPQLTAFLVFSVIDPYPSRTMPSTWNVGPAGTAAAVGPVRRGGCLGAQTLLRVAQWRSATPDATVDALHHEPNRAKCWP